MAEIRENLQATAADDATSSRLANELYVLGHGLRRTASVVQASAEHAWEKPLGTLAEMGVAGVVSTGIGYMTGKGGVRGVLGKGFLAAAGLALVNEGVRPWIDAMGEAWTAQNQQQLDAAADKFAGRTGRLMFDMVVMTPAAVGGTYVGGRLGARALNLRASVEATPARELAVKPLSEGLVESGKAVELAPGLVPGEKARPYRFVQLDPAAPKNPRFDYGVEVSDPRLLHRQPNLDHHRSTDNSLTLSAAEQALKLPLDKLPRPGSVIATIRPDADSVTAMAVLANRLEGRAVNERLVLEIGMRDRISGHRKPPPEDLKDLIDAMHTNVRSDREIHKKVWFAKDVLDGTVNPELVARLADRARASSRSLHHHLDETAKIDVILPNRLALVRADSSAALNRGYEYGSVVVLHNENPHFTRFTVAAMNGAEESKYMGWALRALQKIEPGWGGRSSIFGSPQDRSTKLTPEEVVTVVQRYIDPHPLRAKYYDTVDYLRASRPFTWFRRTS